MAYRHGPKPLLIKLPGIQKEANYIDCHLKEANKTGTLWSEMAVKYHEYCIQIPVLAAPRKAGIPATYQADITRAKMKDTVNFLTMYSCKESEFPLMAMRLAGREFVLIDCETN